VSVRQGCELCCNALSKRGTHERYCGAQRLHEELSLNSEHARGIGRPNGVAVRAELVNLPAATDGERISESSGLR
jgi:hypothetical protein